jgi:hypothetical protein
MPATLTRRHMEPLEQAGSRYAELMRLTTYAPTRKGWYLRTGSFGSRLFEDGERLVAMFGEVLLALDGTVPPASMDGEGGVSQGGEGLGGVAGSGAAGVLAAGPIADVVQAVLDSPMPSRDVEQ